MKKEKNGKFWTKNEKRGKNQEKNKMNKKPRKIWIKKINKIGKIIMKKIEKK